MFGKKPPRPPPDPQTVHQAGRTARAEQQDRHDISASQCPYPAREHAVARERVEWLTGYYDQFVDESEIRARERMGLPLVNWPVPPPTPKKRKQSDDE